MINKARNTHQKLKVLISQPEPSHPSSPYLRLADNHGLDLDFRRFVKIEPVTINEFRKYISIIPEHTAIIFTSKGVIDHFFNLCKEVKMDIHPDMKYFCISEQTANYLQKYIQLKKRKVFIGGRTAEDLLPLFKKHKSEKYLFPCSEVKNNHICSFFENNNLNFSDLIVYRTISNDLSDLDIHSYDVVTLFSPGDVASFLNNFENSDHSNMIFATFGTNTSKTLKSSGYEAHIEAPTTKAPSMAKAIELYLHGEI